MITLEAIQKALRSPGYHEGTEDWVKRIGPNTVHVYMQWLVEQLEEVRVERDELRAEWISMHKDAEQVRGELEDANEFIVELKRQADDPVWQKLRKLAEDILAVREKLDKETGSKG